MHGPGHRSGQGRPHPRHRAAGLPARLAGRAAPGARPAALRRSQHRGQDHRARQEPQQRGPVPPGLAGGDPEGAARRVPRQPEAGRGPPGRRFVGRQLRRLRRPRRHGRPHPRVGAVLEARRPPVVGGVGRRRGRGARCSTSTSTRSASACRSRPPRPTRGRSSPTPTRWASSSTAGSPSSCRSAPSSRWATASRAWSTSRRWPSTTSTCPSRSSPRARSCG